MKKEIKLDAPEKGIDGREFAAGTYVVERIDVVEAAVTDGVLVSVHRLHDDGSDSCLKNDAAAEFVASFDQLNKDATFTALGQQAGRCNWLGDHAGAKFHCEHFQRCLNLEPDSERQRLRKLFDDAWKAENPTRSPKIFR